MPRFTSLPRQFRKQLLRITFKIVALFRKSLRGQFAALTLSILLVAVIGAAALVTGNHAANRQSKITAAKHQTKAPKTGAEQSLSASELSAGQQPAAADPNPGAPGSTAAPTLLVSPSTFTVKQGEPLHVTMQASTGKAIDMPGFAQSYGGKFVMGFDAHPAQKVWTGNVLMLQSPDYPAAGTYTLQVFAQDHSGGTYRGTLTVTITEPDKPAPPVTPTFQIAVQSLGYDAQNDAVSYVIKLTRIGGFSEPVTQVAAFSTAEPDLACYYVIVDDDTIALACGQDDPAFPRPTSGTLEIDVATSSLERSALASYSLPPL